MCVYKLSEQIFYTNEFCADIAPGTNVPVHGKSFERLRYHQFLLDLFLKTFNVTLVI